VADNITYLNNVDTEKVERLVKETRDNVQYFNASVDALVREYCTDLDRLMGDIKQKLQGDIQDITDFDLERYYMNLSSTIYSMCENQEQMGVFADMSKAAQKEVFNGAYLDNQVKDTDKKNKTTVAELTAIGEEASKYETVVSNIYQHAYQMIKLKIDAAKAMAQTIHKIISRRMQEMQLSAYSPREIVPSSREDF
jgi:hypothetical protein